jgi:hypothetical protein
MLNLVQFSSGISSLLWEYTVDTTRREIVLFWQVLFGIGCQLGHHRDPKPHCFCSVEFDPESENLRKESKIVVPDRNQEAAITSIDTAPDVPIRHEPQLKGGFAQLAKKGTIRFTSYNTTEKE